MDLWIDRFIGIRLVFWLYLLASLVFFVVILLYWNREKIFAAYIKIRWPERVIRIRIIYPGNRYNVYYRLIPDDGNIKVRNQVYFFRDDEILKKDDKYIKYDAKEPDIMIATIDGHDYHIDKALRLKTVGDRWPELHYIFNNPEPIQYNVTGKVGLSATLADQWVKNTLIEKFLTLKQEQMTLIFLIIMGAANMAISAFMLSKMMGWLK